MRESRRVQRVEKELKQIISQYLISGLKDPLVGIVTLTRIEASPDLRTAKVFLSMMSEESEKNMNLKNLKERAGEIQREIAVRLPMKYCPKISFLVDKGMDKALKIQKILDGLRISGGDE